MVNFDKVEFTAEAEKFLDKLEEKTRNKVYYNIRKAQHVKDENLFKKLDGEIWEFRTLFKKEKIRLFAFRYRKDNVETMVSLNPIMVDSHSCVNAFRLLFRN